MKLFKIAAIALSLFASSAAFASNGPVDCNTVAKEAKSVCESYNVLRYAVKGYYKDLKDDGRNLEHARVYWRTCKSLFSAIAEGEGRNVIETRLQKVYKKDIGILSQLNFLAGFSEKYEKHRKDILWDKRDFEDKVIAFLSEDDADDFEDDNEADDN